MVCPLDASVSLSLLALVSPQYSFSLRLVRHLCIQTDLIQSRQMVEAFLSSLRKKKSLVPRCGSVCNTVGELDCLLLPTADVTFAKIHFSPHDSSLNWVSPPVSLPKFCGRFVLSSLRLAPTIWIPAGVPPNTSVPPYWQWLQCASTFLLDAELDERPPWWRLVRNQGK